MNKYELCVVLSAKLDDEERAAAIEKIKGFITRYNGTVVEPIEEWGKKKQLRQRSMSLQQKQ